MGKRPQVVVAVWSAALALLGAGCPTTYVVLGEQDGGAPTGTAGAAGASAQGAAGASGCNPPYEARPTADGSLYCEYVGGVGGGYAGAGGGYAGAGGAGGAYAGGGGVAGLWPDGGCNPPYVQQPSPDGVLICEIPSEHGGAGGVGGGPAGAGGAAGGSADPALECELLYSVGSEEYYLCTHRNGQAGAAGEAGAAGAVGGVGGYPAEGCAGASADPADPAQCGVAGGSAVDAGAPADE